MRPETLFHYLHCKLPLLIYIDDSPSPSSHVLSRGSVTLHKQLQSSASLGCHNLCMNSKISQGN